MSDDLIERLEDGAVLRKRRWSGDCHTDQGGPVDEEATDKLMAEAAARIRELEAEREQAEEKAREAVMQSLAHLGQAQDAHEAQKKAEAERDACAAVSASHGQTRRQDEGGVMGQENQIKR